MGKKYISEYKAAKRPWAEDGFAECVAASKSLLEKVHITLQSLRESLDELRELQEEEALGMKIEAVALGPKTMCHNNPVYENVVDTRLKSPIFKRTSSFAACKC